jgi:hypothetical protein
MSPPTIVAPENYKYPSLRPMLTFFVFTVLGPAIGGVTFVVLSLIAGLVSDFGQHGWVFTRPEAFLGVLVFIQPFAYLFGRVTGVRSGGTGGNLPSARSQWVCPARPRARRQRPVRLGFPGPDVARWSSVNRSEPPAVACPSWRWLGLLADRKCVAVAFWLSSFPIDEVRLK